MNVRLLTVSGFLAIVLLAASPAQGQYLTPTDVERLDSPASRYKVTPGMENSIRALLDPFDLDSTLPGGYVWEGITIDRYTVKLVLESGDRRFFVLLLPPVVSVEPLLATPSFKIVAEGEVNDETLAAVTSAIVRNDAGAFWPEAPSVEAGEGRRIPPSVKKVHFTELMGDFFIVLFAIMAFLALALFKQQFSSRSMAWWWLMVSVVAVALIVRALVYLLGAEGQHAAVWTPAAELPHVSVAWYLNTIGRFSLVTLKTVTMLNLVVGLVTVVGVYLLFSMLFEGLLLPPFVAALFVAASPAHAALSCTVTVMVPLVALLVWMMVAQLLYVRTGNIKAHLLAAACCLFAVFARPEAVVLIVPLLAYPFLMVQRSNWLKPAFFVPVLLELLVVAARVSTLHLAPDYPDGFLKPGFSAAALFNNTGVWLFAFTRVSFAAMLLWAVGIAARPWKRDLGTSVIMLAWFLLGLAVYYHVDMTQTFLGGRVSLFFLPVFAFLAAHGSAFLASMEHRQRRWAIAVVIVYLLLSPLIHSRAMVQDYKAVYESNYLVEV